MDSKQIKNSLKEARDEIKNKNFSNAMKICQKILKSDKENYMALVFLGVTLQEIGPQDRAPNAFRKAIQLNPDSPLAWNGLANYYEKDKSISASQELITIYEKLLPIETETQKFSDMIEKLLYHITQIQDVPKGIAMLKELEMNEKLSDSNRRAVWLALATLLASHSDLTSDLLELFELTLSKIVKERSTVTSNYYREYLKLLYKLNKYELLFNEAIRMHALYESNVCPLEWICKIFVELYVEDNYRIVNVFESQMDLYVEKLRKLQENSVMAVFVEAIQKYRIGDFIEARDLLQKVISLRSGLIHAWILLSDCLLNLYCYDEIIQIKMKVQKLLDSSNRDNFYLRTKLERNLVHALARGNERQNWKEAIELGKKILEQNPEDFNILESIIIASINLENFECATNYLKHLQENNTNTHIYLLLNARLLRKQGNVKLAFDSLKDLNLESHELYLELGTIYWELEQYEMSLVPFLKAAKLNPNNYICFVYLGRYYEHFNDTDKARRCYQKAYKQNPCCQEAGVSLAKIFRQKKNWSANLELLQSVTGTNNSLPVINSNVRWAWLQLGLHYLDQGDYGQAINTLRSVIRFEPDNGHYWECLADAYMARGAYTAAMKSYERASELLDDQLYAKLQIASIKLLLGQHTDARCKFEELLSANERYVPALKGLAENCLNLAFIQRKDQLLGACRANAQFALEQLTVALKERGDLSCLWKLAGDSCSIVASLSEKYCYMTVQVLLAEGRESNESITLKRIELYTLAARCYCKAISLNQENMLLWHDLALCYYANACSLTDLSERKQLLNLSLATIKYCVSNNSVSWFHWNLLGVIAVHEDMKNYSLAQHAFIKAVICERNSAVAWSNLGTLYLLLGDVHLANKAFSQAQCGDAAYVNGWIGQALIAETVDDEESMDLFRHSTQLGYHFVGSIGYANWVLRNIIKKSPNTNIYSIDNMHAIPVACDAMTWYTENEPNDSCAWNMLGLLQERLGCNRNALVSFENASRLTSGNDRNLDKVLINHGRLLIKMKRFEEAIRVYKQVKEASFNSGCGLALALFKGKRYEESYNEYDSTMQWLAENENMQSHVLVALAAMAYMFQGPDAAKTLLFQSTQLNPPSQWGLFATLSLGLLHDDLTLAQLVLKELQPMKDKSEIIYHYSVLLSLFYLLQGDQVSAIRSLTKSIHRHPDQASLWLFLSMLLLKFYTKSKSSIAAKCAQVTMKLGRTQMDVTKVPGIVSLATIASNDRKKAVVSAQRALHLYPDVPEVWAIFIFALNAYNESKSDQKLNVWIQTAKKHVIKCLSPSERLLNWLR